MQISDERKFIFIHIPRSAGTSMAAALEPFATREGLAFSQVPWGKEYPHYLPGEIRRIAGEERFRTYFKFAFVRNPWERMLSRYYFLRKFNEKPDTPINERGYYPPGERSFLQWLKGDERHSVHPMDLRPQVTWIMDETGRTVADFVGRHERLEEDFREVCARIGVTLQLPHLNAAKEGDWRESYDDEGRRLVARIFADDIVRWGYRF